MLLELGLCIYWSVYDIAIIHFLLHFAYPFENPIVNIVLVIRQMDIFINRMQCNNEIKEMKVDHFDQLSVTTQSILAKSFKSSL